MDVSIIVVTYQSARDIDACLISLLTALGDRGPEIVVVDNASTDGTAAAVRRSFPSVKVVELDRNLGFAAGINRGLAVTTRRFVLWLNPDSRWSGGSLPDVLRWMDDHPNAGIVGGKILDEDGGIQRSARAFPSYGAVLGARQSLLTRWFPRNPFSRRFLRTDVDAARVHVVDWVSGAFLLHRRSVSERLGGIDEGFFMYFEDVDFCYRAWQNGFKVYFHPGMAITHAIAGSSSHAPARMLVARHRSLWRWYTKHFKRLWAKDAVIWAGVWLRCATLIASSAVRRRRP